MKRIPFQNISLIVCDMAGTVIDEGGLVYKTLFSTLSQCNIPIQQSDIKDWYGLEKTNVIGKMISKYDNIRCPIEEERRNININMEFEKNLHKEYFSNDSTLKLIDPKLPNFFKRLQSNGIKIALNTGYAPSFQKKIIKHLNMTDFIDDFISSGDVNFGRPAPYMIHHLMEKHDIRDVERVAKIGDTKNDILEGKNSGCGLIIGVLSGAGNREDLQKADIIVNNIVDLRNFECDDRYLF